MSTQLKTLQELTFYLLNIDKTICLNESPGYQEADVICYMYVQA